MPIAGVRCAAPYHKKELYSFEECLKCAKERGPRRCDVPYQVIKLMSENTASRKDAGFSATMLTDMCARRVILGQEVDFYESPLDVWPRIRGTIHHMLVEEASGGLEPFVAEVRFKKTIEVDGVQFELTGKPDLVLVDEKMIVDFKSIGDTQSEFKTIKSRIASEEHVWQINIYRWLLWGGEATEDDVRGGVVKKGDIVHLDIEYGGIQYMDNSTLKKCDAEIWPVEQTTEFIRERLRPFIHYKQTGEMPDVIRNIFGERHLFCNNCPLREACDERLAA